MTLPVPPRPHVVSDPWCQCRHRRLGHHVTPSGAVTYCCNGQGRGQCPCKKFTPARWITADEFAQSLVEPAAELVDLVHGAGGQADVAALLNRVRQMRRPDDLDPMVALAVVLAAMVPGDVVPARALSWINWNWQEAG